MFDVKYKTDIYNQKEIFEAIDYEKQITDQNIDVKPYLSEESLNDCQQLNTCANQSESFDNDWYNSDDIYYLKTFDELTPSSMDQIIATTIRDDLIDSGFEESPISMNNCDEINNYVLNSLCNDLDSKQEINENYIPNNENHFKNIETTDICQRNNGIYYPNF